MRRARLIGSTSSNPGESPEDFPLPCFPAYRADAAPLSIFGIIRFDWFPSNPRPPGMNAPRLVDAAGSDLADGSSGVRPGANEFFHAAAELLRPERFGKEHEVLGAMTHKIRAAGHEQKTGVI